MSDLATHYSIDKGHIRIARITVADEICACVAKVGWAAMNAVLNILYIVTGDLI